MIFFTFQVAQSLQAHCLVARAHVELVPPIRSISEGEMSGSCTEGSLSRFQVWR